MQNTAGSPGAQEAYPVDTKFASLTRHTTTLPHRNVAPWGGMNPAARDPREKGSSLPGCFQAWPDPRSPRRCKAGAGTPPPRLLGEGGEQPRVSGSPPGWSGWRQSGKEGSAKEAWQCPPSPRQPPRAPGAGSRHKAARGAHLQG